MLGAILEVIESATDNLAAERVLANAQTDSALSYYHQGMVSGVEEMLIALARAIESAVAS